MDVDPPPRLARRMLRDIVDVARSAPPGQVGLVANPKIFRYPTRTFRSLSAFPITDKELNVIAALAIIGLSIQPNTG